jgi:hypothetical protein
MAGTFFPAAWTTLCAGGGCRNRSDQKKEITENQFPLV